MLANIFDGIMNAISMGSLLANLMGVTLGIIFGALPGLTAAMGVALLIPLTFGMPAVEAFSALLGMYVGAIYGGCITAILVGTPGTVSAAATMLEGPALTARGESRRALDMATIASFVGGIVSALALIFIAPMLARAAMSFGLPNISRWPCSALPWWPRCRPGISSKGSFPRLRACSSPLSASIP